MKVKLKKYQRAYIAGCLTERHRELMRRWEVHLATTRCLFHDPTRIEASGLAMRELEKEMRLLEKTAERVGLSL